MGSGASTRNPPSGGSPSKQHVEAGHRKQPSPSIKSAVVVDENSPKHDVDDVENASIKGVPSMSAKAVFDEDQESLHTDRRNDNDKFSAQYSKPEKAGGLTESADLDIPEVESKNDDDNNCAGGNSNDENDNDKGDKADAQSTTQPILKPEEECCYFGDLDDAGLRSGQGIQRYETGDIYKGEWENDKKHGHGIYRFADGSVYEGRFKNDCIHGNGVHIFEDGAMYSGRFKNDQQSGHGTYIFISGSMYQGQWKDNAMHGAGVYVYGNGDRYKGQFKYNEMHGVGVAKVNGGETVKVGTFENGKPVDVKTTHHGSSLVIEIKGLEELLTAKNYILKRAPTDRVVAYIASQFNLGPHRVPAHAKVEGSHLLDNAELQEGEDQL